MATSPTSKSTVAAQAAATTTTTEAAALDAPPMKASFTLEQAIAEALARHPLLRAARADERAADARVDEAHLRELPSAGVSAELNRSTGNTVPGAFFYSQGFPAISGPVEGKALNAGNWQTGASIWASWDVLTFAREAGVIDSALAQRRVSTARVSVVQLDVAYGAADAFLLLLEAQETVRAAQATVDRAETLVAMTKPLVDQTLRPGVDLARAQAELAAARTLLANATQARDVRRANLAVAIGEAGLVVEAAPGNVLEPVDVPRQPARIADNPQVVEANAVVERFSGERAAVRAQFLPRIDLVAALYARGTGLSVVGLSQSPANGLVPDVANWAAGLVVTWSALDIPSISARSRAANADYTAAIARRDQVVLAVSGQLESASAFLRGAQSIARETPIALSAARAAEQQALARYRTTLAPIVDVADAERVLTQAEINDAIARIEVRRALLALARAAGDLGPLLSR
ncbi:TolC family protein [Labilithrix luteola]|nr:TolC family protein [Labilithrix luteola]